MAVDIDVSVVCGLASKKFSNQNLQIIILELPRLEEGPNDIGSVWFSSCIAHIV